MVKPRVIIADTDISYILSLQRKFIEACFEKIDLEVISDQNYYEKLFGLLEKDEVQCGSPQKADVLIVSEELYDVSIHRHDIGTVFVMTEQDGGGRSGNSDVISIFKYTNVENIFNLITGRCPGLIDGSGAVHKTTKVLLVCSASGGVGKTTVALGISACLNAESKRVLYLNAERLQSFQTVLFNSSPITSPDLYARLVDATENVYSEIKHFIRSEGFYYIPPFKAALMSLEIPYSVYGDIVVSIKRTQEYDYIIVDADTVFDEEKIRLFDIADKVIIVTKQNKMSAYATKMLIANINEANSDKYMYVCNDFMENETNYLISPDVINKFTVSYYIEHMPYHEQLAVSDLAREKDLQQVAFLLL